MPLQTLEYNVYCTMRVEHSFLLVLNGVSPMNNVNRFGMVRR